jgi:ketosteroid isomerase-like protein
MTGAVASLVLILLFLCANVTAQGEREKLSQAEAAFEQAVAEKGAKEAFQLYLLPDAILFKPDPINGLDFYKIKKDPPGFTLVRRLTDVDVSSNGLLGYTTGDWRLYEKGKSEASAKFGQSVTIWKKNANGEFRIALDIGITHDKLSFEETDRVLFGDKGSDPNTRGWSPADASMNFFRMSMASRGLADGYERFAADDVRLLIEKEPPILGKKRVQQAIKDYRSIAFPRKVTSFVSADMAYTWNPCEFDNHGEGIEKGNCLHVWKLRNKKWWIVLGIFSRVSKGVPPRLLEKRAGQ